eukprot:CAMPEP_0178382586 /NCGR_PEP_ID=MMETSP0689_2-20121128/6568_1 /TAXON_ID=160604 /ORGANISM="Amphidinium massartii, Strain CS-259" /LENGTH=284 /DNA_ID=CAMNT_0020002791 /DNA_START=56 /DNA_END=906 /DNA_ORIENTATION=-
MSSTLRKCKPYLDRASELDAEKPLIAYYCRLYVLELLAKGRAAGDTAPESKELLLEMLAQAEVAKQGLDLSQGPAAAEEFALSVFVDADKADRACCSSSTLSKPQRHCGLSGNLAMGVVSQLFAAGLYLDMLSQFHDGELPPDLAEKAKYAKSRAVQIRECVTKGLEITPPATGQSSEGGADDCTQAFPVDASLAPSAGSCAAAASVVPAAPASSPAAPPSTAAQAGASILETSSGSASRSAGYPPAKILAAKHAAPEAEAQRKLEFAISALDFDDVQSAVRFL